jgi:hypothetical protein
MTKAGAAFHQPQQGFWMRASVRVSTLLVASSRIRMAGSARMARAMAKSWRWPWLRLPARSESICLVALRKLADKVIGIRQPGSLDTFFIGCIQPPVADVFHYGIGEQKGVLQHQPHLAAQVSLLCRCRADRAHRSIFCRLGFHRSGLAVDDGGFSSPGWAYQGDGLPGFGFQGHILNHRMLRLVAKTHIFKLYVPLNDRQRLRICRVCYSDGVSMISNTRSAPARAA